MRRVLAKSFGTIVVWSILFILLVIAQAAHGQAVKIMPLGDSLTSGHRHYVSYRYDLWFDLIDAGFDVDFVGTLKNTADGPNLDWYPEYLTTFDRDHQGQWGYQTDELVRIARSSSIKYQPDIVLLLAGVNDIWNLGAGGVSNARFGLRDIIEGIRSAVPGVTILLGEMNPYSGPNAEFLEPLNDAIAIVASELDTTESPVILVDHYTGFDIASMTFGGLHHNLVGEAWVAENWFEVLANIMTTTNYTLSVSKTGLGSGTVTSSPSGINCGNTCSKSFASGTSITLTATPASGSTFGGWSGSCSGTGTCNVSMAQARSVTARFELPTPEPFQINAGHSGAWYNPVTSGQGQLIDVIPETQYMFLAWFTFTAAASNNPEEQHWYTAQGNYSGNTAELILHETLGGQFDDPQETSTNPVGTVTVSFTDCEQGQMVYSIDTDGRQGTIPLQRLLPGSGDVCEEQRGKADITTEAVDIKAGMDGAWVNEDTLGQGFLIDAHPNPEGDNYIYVAWFTYGDNTASGQRWLTAQGNFEGSTAEIDINETTGGRFDDPQLADTNKVGTMTIDFTDCSNALLTYSLTDDDLADDMEISRLIPGGQALCEELAEAE
jgi:hypothetical protein